MAVIVKSTPDSRSFLGKINELCGDRVERCMQCGACAGACPLVRHMDVSPRLLMHLLQVEDRQRVEHANTAWVCATCNSCQVECPQHIEIPSVMEAVRQLKLRTNEDFVPLSEMDAKHLKRMPTIAMVSCLRKHSPT